jgi:hypothetical protein
MKMYLNPMFSSIQPFFISSVLKCFLCSFINKKKNKKSKLSSCNLALKNCLVFIARLCNVSSYKIWKRSGVELKKAFSESDQDVLLDSSREIIP